jgi:hypothetical protein
MLQFSHVGVTSRQHGGEPGRLFLAATAFTRLFEVPVIAHDFQRAFTVDFFLQSPQRFLNGLALFQLNFCQTNSLPLEVIWGNTRPPWLVRPPSQDGEVIFAAENVNRQNYPIGFILHRHQPAKSHLKPCVYKETRKSGIQEKCSDLNIPGLLTSSILYDFRAGGQMLHVSRFTPRSQLCPLNLTPKNV